MSLIWIQEQVDSNVFINDSLFFKLKVNLILLLFVIVLCL